MHKSTTIFPLNNSKNHLIMQNIAPAAATLVQNSDNSIEYFTDTMHKSMYPADKMNSSVQKTVPFCNNLKSHNIKTNIRRSILGK